MVAKLKVTANRKEWFYKNAYCLLFVLPLLGLLFKLNLWLEGDSLWNAVYSGWLFDGLKNQSVSTWLHRMVYFFSDSHPPLLVWLGQFFYGVGVFFGSGVKGLFIFNAVVFYVGLNLFFETILRLHKQRLIAYTCTGILALSPLLLNLSCWFLPHYLQVVFVIWFIKESIILITKPLTKDTDLLLLAGILLLAAFSYQGFLPYLLPWLALIAWKYLIKKDKYKGEFSYYSFGLILLVAVLLGLNILYYRDVLRLIAQAQWAFYENVPDLNVTFVTRIGLWLKVYFKQLINPLLIYPLGLMLALTVWANKKTKAINKTNKAILLAAFLTVFLAIAVHIGQFTIWPGRLLASFPAMIILLSYLLVRINIKPWNNGLRIFNIWCVGIVIFGVLTIWNIVPTRLGGEYEKSLGYSLLDPAIKEQLTLTTAALNFINTGNKYVEVHVMGQLYTVTWFMKACLYDLQDAFSKNRKPVYDARRIKNAEIFPFNVDRYLVNNPQKNEQDYINEHLASSKKDAFIYFETPQLSPAQLGFVKNNQRMEIFWNKYLRTISKAPTHIAKRFYSKDKQQSLLLFYEKGLLSESN